MKKVRIKFDVYEFGSSFWEENRQWSDDCEIDDIQKIEPIQYSDRYKVIFKPNFIPDGYNTVIDKEQLNQILEILGENTEIIDYEILNAIDCEKNGQARIEEMFEKLRKQFSS